MPEPTTTAAATKLGLWGATKLGLGTAGRVLTGLSMPLVALSMLPAVYHMFFGGGGQEQQETDQYGAYMTERDMRPFGGSGIDAQQAYMARQKSTSMEDMMSRQRLMDTINASVSPTPPPSNLLM